jgi:hypothetical protein
MLTCCGIHRFVSAAMNAIISLCHFCEVHGPSVLQCTQAFHEPEVSVHVDDSEVFSTSESLCSDCPKSGPKSLDCIITRCKADEQLGKAGSSSAPSSPTSSCPERLKPDTCEVNCLLLYLSIDNKLITLSALL